MRIKKAFRNFVKNDSTVDNDSPGSATCDHLESSRVAPATDAVVVVLATGVLAEQLAGMTLLEP